MRIIRAGSKFPFISICIPTYHAGHPRMQECLSRIWCNTTRAFEVIVADCQGELLGYTDPQNAAIQASICRFVVAMNDDVLVSPGWLDELLIPFYNISGLPEDEVWCSTPDQTHADGPQVFAPYCMVWRQGAWDELGGLDPQFKWWCSDIDLARRLEEKGHLPTRVKLPWPIDHKIGATATGEHQEVLNQWAKEDLDRYRNKWGVSAEEDKYRLRDLVWSPSQA